MRLLLDTHAFLWLVDGDERLPEGTRRLIDRAEVVFLSVASVWEAEIKRAQGRLGGPPLVEAAGAVDVDVLPIEAAHALAAANLPPHHRDPFDRMLVAQAQEQDLVLISKDAVLRAYGVPVAW